MFAGIIARPRAISLRTSSGSSFSRFATYCISSVITPCRARCICDMLRLPFFPAASASRFSIQLSRIAISPPKLRPSPANGKSNYGTATHSQQLAGMPRGKRLRKRKSALEFVEDLVRAQSHSHDDRVLRLFQVTELSGQDALAREVAVARQNVRAHFLVGPFEVDDLHIESGADRIAIFLLQRGAGKHATVAGCVLTHEFLVHGREPRYAVRVVQRNSLLHFFDIGRGMKIVRVEKRPMQFAGKKFADCRLARPCRAHHEYDHGESLRITRDAV